MELIYSWDLAHTCLGIYAVYHVEALSTEGERVGQSSLLRKDDIGDPMGFHKMLEEGVGLEGLRKVGPGVLVGTKGRGVWSTVLIYPRSLQCP